jgi:hypothetical protein
MADNPKKEATQQCYAKDGAAKTHETEPAAKDRRVHGGHVLMANPGYVSADPE